MNVTRGKVNENLLPIVPVSAKKEDNEWQEINLLLDTGFNGDICLEAALLDGHCLATQPHRQLLTPDEALESYDNRGPIAPYKFEVLWKGSPREASLRLLEKHPFCGTLGTGLLLYHLEPILKTGRNLQGCCVKEILGCI